MNLVDTADALTRELARLKFSRPVSYVYEPLVYAREAYALYVERYGRGRREVVLLGMNPGPWGMVQTGVPFGDVSAVRDWLGIEAAVGKPPSEHPKRPILGFACRRREVSGTRFWGWAQQRFDTPQRFFRRFFVANYCPLVFLEESGRNLTPDKLPAGQRRPLLEACDRALCRTVARLKPQYVIGIGRFAEARARIALADTGVKIGCILHPSPATPRATSGWTKLVEKQFAALGIAIP